MASAGNAQTKLNHVVETIAEAVSSEVCSIYLRREGVLELYATRGLNQEAVHVTKLAFGEGLTGYIAKNVETLNLDEAASHPDFQYRPETGEEKFHSFAGVPIIRNQQAVGVLCAQHIEPRKYSEEEIESFQTAAMVLSELISNAELIDVESVDTTEARNNGADRLSGLQLVKGKASGFAVFHQPRVKIEHTVAEDTEAERHRVYSAFDKMRDQIDQMTNQAEFGVGGEHEEVLQTYKMFAYDEGWSRRINEAIDSGLTAEAAIERVQQHTRMRMRQIDDPLLAERMHDLEDLANRLLRIVSGQMGTAATMGLRQDTILVARNLGPAELLEYDRRRLKGVVLEEGSLTAHVTIIARAMDIPILGQVKNVRQIVRENDHLLLNVDDNALFVRPSPSMEDAFETQIELTQKKRAAYTELKDKEPVTKDGTRITLNINAGLRDDMGMLNLTGADGIGLFRTEFQFLVAAKMPGRSGQLRFYRDVLDAAGDKPVIFRTVDIGGDKPLPYFQASEVKEENPAMGWRALRIGLERDALMKVQARSLIEAAAGRKLNVMFPMIAEPWEFDEAKAVFEKQLEFLRSRKKQVPLSIRYGAMLEVPALAECLDQMASRLDFLSIGTNDLTQFLFAADRSNPKLAERFDWLSPAILRFIGRVSRQADDLGIELSVCGEMGGRPLDALALLGLGIKRLSITPASVGPIKAMVRSLDLTAVKNHLQTLLSDPPSDPRTALRQWAKQQHIDLD
ncbi:phosphoenolpyruvate--protein phosphotransferase [Parasphingorhabdus cellanae]|uniref:phosphoenolpyruvate--protein phosphotransferase n=2 Tax=Parasphingorhabdus cellanae TaxID=2806553 RepID=A0ABX7T887_9SPHN|nr:phosphoenolpyruvate--protein phosphotransferase [Parasphingorhabdus cellanae]